MRAWAAKRATAQRSVSVPPGVNAGWVSVSAAGGGGYRTGPERLRRYVDAYGGSENSIVWVYCAANLRASTLAAYEFDLLDGLDDVVESPPDDLARLLRKPNPTITWPDFCEITSLDLDLQGNSYWLKNRRNALGQPAEMIRFPADKVRVVLAPDGREVGYVLLASGQTVPYDLDEVIHLRMRNPRNDHYGMGVVEATFGQLALAMAEQGHLQGFLENGARISGILSVPETLTDAQFQRFQDQFAQQYAGAAQAYKILIAEKTQSYTPVTATPAALGIIDLLKLDKDAILSAFNVPAPMLGGTMENANYKMEDSQHIFTRGMGPLARKVSAEVSSGLVERWEDEGVAALKIKTHTNDPMSVRLEQALGMMRIGASADDALDHVGQARKNLPETKEPMVDWHLRPAKEMLNAAEFAAAPGAPTAPTIAAARPAIKVRAEQGEARALPPAEPPEPPFEDFEAFGPIPEGKGTYADHVALAEDHNEQIRRGVPEVRDGFRSFFDAQETRVRERLSGFGSLSSRARARGDLKNRADLTSHALWPEGEENAALVAAYRPLVDAVGARSIETPARLVEAEIRWDLQHPFVSAARDRLCALVVRINETTRSALAEQVEEGMRRGYSIPQIANGFGDEGYRGIAGVFEDARGWRAENIARTETAMIYNAASTAAYREGGVEKVLVLDGVGDPICAAANGETWTLEEADADPLGHPGCTRAFSGISSNAGEGS